MTRDDHQIFVVDDDEAVRDSLCLMLRTAYPIVRPYASGLAFLNDHRLMARNCLVIDVHMPDMTGFDVIERLADRKERVPAILMTGRADSMLRAQAIELGAHTLIDKPIDFDELTAFIDRVLTSPHLH